MRNAAGVTATCLLPQRCTARRSHSDLFPIQGSNSSSQRICAFRVSGGVVALALLHTQDFAIHTLGLSRSRDLWPGPSRPSRLQFLFLLWSASAAPLLCSVQLCSYISPTRPASSSCSLSSAGRISLSQFFNPKGSCLLFFFASACHTSAVAHEVGPLLF